LRRTPAYFSKRRAAADIASLPLRRQLLPQTRQHFGLDVILFDLALAGSNFARFLHLLPFVPAAAADNSGNCPVSFAVPADLSYLNSAAGQYLPADDSCFADLRAPAPADDSHSERRTGSWSADDSHCPDSIVPPFPALPLLERRSAVCSWPVVLLWFSADDSARPPTKAQSRGRRSPASARKVSRMWSFVFIPLYICCRLLPAAWSLSSSSDCACDKSDSGEKLEITS